ncbi:KH domain-containing protein [Aphelenchoides fujianensis]|nr:KH domain-containing protein [Aphelenchoides fujianensis]
MEYPYEDPYFTGGASAPVGYGAPPQMGGPPTGVPPPLGYGDYSGAAPSNGGYRGRGRGAPGMPPPMRGLPRGGMGRGGAPMGGPRGGGPMRHPGQRMMGGMHPDFYGPPGVPYEQSPLDAEVMVVCGEMHTEIAALDQSGEYGEQFKNARRLLATEVERLENNIDPEWLEVDVEKPIKLIRKVLIPTFRHPRFNYVGKVLGPRGTTLQNIAKQFKCHVYILGRGSTRDRAKEEELLNSGDPNYAHYAGPLHVKIETNAPPALAYQRVSGVLDVLQQLLQPVKETYIPNITLPPEPRKDEERHAEDEAADANGDQEPKADGGDAKAGEDGEKGVELQPQPALNRPGGSGPSYGGGGRGGGGNGRFQSRGGPGRGRGGMMPRGGPPMGGRGRGGTPMMGGGMRGGGGYPRYAPY